jgi:uncharacterized glyoxalase superfamily protein PhnB
MTEPRSVSSEVEVGVDADTAFAAFTEEMDLWWVRGPINYYDAARAVAQRCEPGVGGRLLEVYDDETGDALELGRITVWEPGARLAWRSSTDDVEIEVRFDRSRGGTTVRVDARIPAGGEDRGGTSWVRVVPPWFGAWCARREGASREPRDLALLALAVYYAKPATAARWLARVFGFEATNPISDDARSWIEFRVGNCSLMVFKMEGDLPDRSPTTHEPWVYVDDLDAHFARAQANGATIVEGIHQHGFRAYVAEDLEGHRWTIAQARPTMLT